jgi:hypothetical protein
MNTKLASRGLFSRLRRVLMALLVVMLLFGSVPVGRARAAATGWFDSFVRCNQGYYTYTFSVQGAYNNQYVAYRFHEYRWNGAWIPVQTSSWGYFWATTPFPPAITNATLNPATKNTYVRVITEVLFWDNVTNRYQSPIYKTANHIEFMGPATYYTHCKIWL